MKKNFWVIASVILIISLLYSRPYFLQESVNEKEKTSKFAVSLVVVPAVVAPEGEKSIEKVTLTFPPRSEPLILPAYTYPPFTMKDEAGRWVGADTEITEAVLNRMGYQVQWVDMAFARALEEMRSGKYPAMLPCVVGGGREEYILFSEPVSSIFSVLWKKKTDKFSWSIYDDLEDRVIGASHYHYGAGFFEAAEAGKFKVDMVAGKEPEVTHFRKLLQGKIDMFICERSLGSYLRHKHSPEFDEVDYSTTGVGPTRPFCFAVSRKYFEGREDLLHAFIAAFNEKLEVVAKEGRRKEIFDKYQMLIGLDDEGSIVIPGGGWKPQ